MEEGKLILDLCGGTGAWSRPYAEAGYDVRVLTLPKYDLLERAYVGDTKMRLSAKTGEEETIALREVYGILAAPTCTMFSLARTRAKEPRDFREGMRLVKRCLEIIWACREQPESNLKFWALENPTGYLRQFLGRPYMTFSPEEYGESYTKKTDLWGYFVRPKKHKRELTEEEKVRCKNNTRVLPQLPDGYVVPEGWNETAARRSVTSAKFAEAFFRANR